MENLIFDGTSRLKLEMTLYSDNAYDVTNFFVVLKSSWLPSLIVVRPQMAELNWGVAFLPPVHYRGIPDPVQNRVNDYFRFRLPKWQS